MSKLEKQGEEALTEVRQNRILSTTTTGFTDVDDTPITIGKSEPQLTDVDGTVCTTTLPSTTAPHLSISRSALVDCMIVPQAV